MIQREVGSDWDKQVHVNVFQMGRGQTQEPKQKPHTAVTSSR